MKRDHIHSGDTCPKCGEETNAIYFDEDKGNRLEILDAKPTMAFVRFKGQGHMIETPTFPIHRCKVSPAAMGAIDEILKDAKRLSNQMEGPGLRHARLIVEDAFKDLPCEELVDQTARTKDPICYICHKPSERKACPLKVRAGLLDERGLCTCCDEHRKTCGSQRDNR